MKFIKVYAVLLLLMLLLAVGLYAHELAFEDTVLGGWIVFGALMFGPIGGAFCGYIYGLEDQP